MECTKFIIFLLMSLTSPVFPFINGSQQKTLTNLNRFKIEGVVASFVVDQEALKQVLESRKQQDSFSGHDVWLQLPQPLLPSAYNATQEGEIFICHGTVTDITLAKELSSDLKEHVATNHRFLSVSTPVLIGKKERPGVLYLRIFTDSNKRVIHPYSTSIGEVTQLDSMKKTEDGIVRLRIGDDVMAYKVQDEVNDLVEIRNVGKDFDKTSGKVLTFTSYPLPFDWGCNFMGSQISFCQAVEEVQCALAAVGGNVCLEIETSSSKRLPASMTILNMTGIFRDMFPYLAEKVPCESFEAELIDREHTTGITFPCFTY